MSTPYPKDLRAREPAAPNFNDAVKAMGYGGDVRANPQRQVGHLPGVNGKRTVGPLKPVFGLSGVVPRLGRVSVLSIRAFVLSTPTRSPQVRDSPLRRGGSCSTQTQGPSTPQITALAMICSGRDARIEEMKKTPLKPKAGLNGPPSSSQLSVLSWLCEFSSVLLGKHSLRVDRNEQPAAMGEDFSLLVKDFCHIDVPAAFDSHLA
jgi:hypothetical protein